MKNRDDKLRKLLNLSVSSLCFDWENPMPQNQDSLRCGAMYLCYWFCHGGREEGSETDTLQATTIDGLDLVISLVSSIDIVFVVIP